MLLLIKSDLIMNLNVKKKRGRIYEKAVCVSFLTALRKKGLYLSLEVGLLKTAWCSTNGTSVSSLCHKPES